MKGKEIETPKIIVSGPSAGAHLASILCYNTSSVFVSQDPVAIDSVGADFLMNEPVVADRNGALKDNSNVENYLHEAGLVRDAPSGNVYQNGNGEIVTNLGVHEHWNNSAEKLYGRNLGKDEGIELISIVR